MVLRLPLHNLSSFIASSILHGALAYGLLYGSIGETGVEPIQSPFVVDIVYEASQIEMSVPVTERAQKKSEKSIIATKKKTQKAKISSSALNESGKGLTIDPCAANLSPPYPEEARLKGVEGQVIIRLTIDVRGKVVRAECLNQAPPLLLKAVLNTVKTWHFNVSGRLSGMTETVDVPFNFALDEF